KIVCDLVDMTVYLLSMSIYRTVRASQEPEIGTKFSYRLGRAAEKLIAAGDTLLHREKKNRKLTESFALKEEALKDTGMRIRRSFSFALLMAGIGICIVFVYLLANIK
ncbi:MAG TPA: hypothetical protein PLT66_04925, partial [Bacillota bacterium]|nr:hypothetical protein [Bacillota bacterium]